MEITFEPKQKYILVNAKGEVDPQTAKELFIKLLGVCADHKLYNVIVDYREVVGYLSIIDRLNYLKGVDALHETCIRLGIPKLRIAYLAPIDLEITEPVVVKRRATLSFDNMATHDIKSAKKWIMK